METQLNPSNSGAPPGAAVEPLSSRAATPAGEQVGDNVASLDVAAAGEVRADLTVLGLDQLLELDIGSGAESRGSARLSDESYPSFHDDDLPVPSFHDDDLPAPLFHDDDLPVPSIHDEDLPADLTTVRLGQLLGLQLAGGALPTVGEVVRMAFRAAKSNENKTKKSDDADSEEESPETEVQESSPPIVQAGDLSFIDPESLTEQAEANSATPSLSDLLDAELFGLSSSFSSEEGGFSDVFDLDNSELPPPEESGGGSGGGGTNVINGTPGNDLLNGSAGDDILHGFAGDDTLDGGLGSDRLDGGLGDDVLVWDANDTSIDGKNGTDTLRVDSGDADFTTFGGNLSGLEVVDLQSDAGANNLSLTAQNVLDATDNGNSLTITGNVGDALDASNGWTYVGMGGGYDIYTQIVGPQTATLNVGLTIAVNANILL